MGGLGNMLFQISTSYAASLRNGMDFCADLSNYHGGHGDISRYFTNILRNVKFCGPTIVESVYGESNHYYSELPLFSSSTKLIGYFQSEKYFNEFRKEILDFLSPTIEITKKLTIKFGRFLNNETCSIHVRRGDYVDLSDFYINLSEKYFESAVKKIGEDKMFLIFSDDINWCKKNLNFIDNKIFVEGLEDYESIYLMSMCKHNIISNSTFGWWGAWMNKNENKIVVSSSQWFGPNLVGLLDSKDINCKNWIKI
jgi:hypothetical protein